MQPREVRLQLGEQLRRREVPRQRFVTVQHITWVFLHYNIDCVEKAIEVTFHDKWRSDVRHDEITDEHHAQIFQVNEHGVMRLSAMDGNQLDVGSANFQLGLAIDGCVGLETPYAIGVVAFPKEASLNGG